MAHQQVFISYNRHDAEIADRLAAVFRKRGYNVWLDRISILAGENWPQKMGEGIAESDVMLLVWSKNSGQSHFVEMEWTAAVAMKKPILPYRLDDTPLPLILSAINAPKMYDVERDAAAIADALDKAAEEESKDTSAADAPPITPPEAMTLRTRGTEPLETLAAEIVHRIKSTISAENIHPITININIHQESGQVISGNVGGHVIDSGGGNVVINHHGLSNRALLIIGGVIVVAVVVILVFVYMPPGATETLSYEARVLDKSTNMPIAGVTVRITEIDGKTATKETTTSSSGSFKFVLAYPPGTSLRIAFAHADYHPADDYFILADPENVTLERVEQ